MIEAPAVRRTLLFLSAMVIWLTAAHCNGHPSAHTQPPGSGSVSVTR